MRTAFLGVYLLGWHHTIDKASLFFLLQEGAVVMFFSIASQALKLWCIAFLRRDREDDDGKSFYVTVGTLVHNMPWVLNLCLCVGLAMRCVGLISQETWGAVTVCVCCVIAASFLLFVFLREKLGRQFRWELYLLCGLCVLVAVYIPFQGVSRLGGVGGREGGGGGGEGWLGG